MSKVVLSTGISIALFGIPKLKQVGCINEVNDTIVSIIRFYIYSNT